jgi:hypothetical protein
VKKATSSRRVKRPRPEIDPVVAGVFIFIEEACL